MKKIISTSCAPSAIGPYSQAVRAGNMIFTSGQLPINPETGEFAGQDIGAQTRQCLLNVEAVLKSEGVKLSDIVKVTVFMQDLSQFADMNSVYESFFPENPPARSCVQVAALPKAAAVEIEAVAVV